MIEASCHCGKVKLQIAHAPRNVTDCNCSICLRYGALWAYYQRKDVAISGSTKVYSWMNHRIGFHRCENCGCVTHWLSTDPAGPRMAVNARIMPPEILAQAVIRKLDGASW